MAVRTPQASNLDNRRTNNLEYFGEQTVNTWVRNPAWVAMPTVTSSENKLVGLYAVFPGDASGLSNYITVVAGGAYTVNYGDGTTTNYNSNVQANYEYDYDNAALDGTNAPVTFQDTGDTVTRNNHGYTDGMEVQFYNIVSTTGINEGQTYYVINSTTNTFQISDSVGGAAIALTTDGSATLLPYKIATVIVTPQAGSLTSINLQYRHSSITQTSRATSSGWLDINLSAPSCSQLYFSYLGNQYAYPRLLERVQIQSIGNITDARFMFWNASALQSVSWPSNNSSLINAGEMFYLCSSLETAPFINTANVTNMFSMFQSCYNLKSVPLYNTANVTSMGQMFFQCYNLKSVPLFNTVKVTNMSSMFFSCYNLESVPLFNTVAVTTMASMLSSCWGLKSVPLFNTSLVTSMNSMFQNCYNLESVPLFDTSSATSMVSMFSNCFNLKTVPLFNTIAVTSMNGMFGSCVILETVPSFNTANVTNMGSMFATCYNLKSVPLFNTSKVTDSQSMFNGCFRISVIPNFDTSNTTNMSSMFSSCYSLKSVPSFNTSKATNMSGLFNSCLSLETAPAINTSNVTNMSSMFTSCSQLTQVPTYITGNTVMMASMFDSCTSLKQVPAMNTSSVGSSANLTFIFANCPSLNRIQAKEFKYTFSVTNCNLSANALNEIYTNLPTVTAQTITVTGNPGVAGDDPTIATGKGWTVTG